MINKQLSLRKSLRSGKTLLLSFKLGMLRQAKGRR